MKTLKVINTISISMFLSMLCGNALGQVHHCKCAHERTARMISYNGRLSFDRDNKKLNIIPGYFNKKNNAINIILKNKKVITFKDKIKSSDDVYQKVYKYIGFIKEINSHVLKLSEFETGNYILINSESGSITSIWNLPYISPDGCLFVTSAANVDYETAPNGIQIFRIGKYDIKRVAEFKTEEWEPRRIKWKNNNIIYIEKLIPDYLSPTKKEILQYGIVIIK